MGVSLLSETEHLTPSPRLDRNPLNCGLESITQCSDRYRGQEKRGKRQHWSGVEKSNMRQRMKTSVTVILNGSGDTEEPRNVTSPTEQTSCRSGGGDDGEDVLHDVVGSTLADEGESLVQYLLRVIDDTVNGTLV
ncbi:hypothetical protein F2Q70_00042911 [Brassica cretica]|uniref:Uncharacterized protein n=1 Tax=Brassica cretica TaxID=69181 RepID=A0A8S9KP47_BRACR|nr:hypothetical protein F2Q70_00042911 [Brassica cretica]